MARTNKRIVVPAPRLAGGAGAEASRITPLQRLRRIVLAHLLWEDNFYSDGVSTTQAIADSVAKVSPQDVLNLAVEAREVQNLRHVPLFLLREAARHDHLKGIVSDGLARVIQRPDEIGEYLALYFKDDANQPLSAASKKGLARAFNKFNEFQFAKNNRDGAFTLKDALFLTHARPKDEEQADIFRAIAGGFCRVCLRRSDAHTGVRGGRLRHEFDERKLMVPNTWETRLSAGESAASTFTDLIQNRQIGGLAMLRNLRNMKEAGLSKTLIRQGLMEANYQRVLPFRFIAAALQVPAFEDIIEEAFLSKVDQFDRLSGHTVAIIDVSGSMSQPLAVRGGARSYVSRSGAVRTSEPMSRLQAGIALMMLLREQSESISIYATAGSDSLRRHRTEQVRPRRGFALRDELQHAYSRLGGGGIFLTQVMDAVAEAERGNVADRVIVFTDEQDTSGYGRAYNPANANAFGRENYIINVAAEHNGIGYNKFHKIDGFSEAAIRYIAEIEKPEVPVESKSMTRRYQRQSASSSRQ